MGPIRLTSENWGDVLLLLAVMMVADGDVRDVESDAFVRAALRLGETLGGEAVDASAARGWLSRNLARAQAVAAERDLFVAVLPSLTALRTLEREARLAVLDALGRVADVDLERAPPEHGILALASAFWGVERAVPGRHPGAPDA